MKQESGTRSLVLEYHTWIAKDETAPIVLALLKRA